MWLRWWSSLVRTGGGGSLPPVVVPAVALIGLPLGATHHELGLSRVGRRRDHELGEVISGVHQAFTIGQQGVAVLLGHSTLSIYELIYASMGRPFVLVFASDAVAEGIERMAGGTRHPRLGHTRMRAASRELPVRRNGIQYDTAVVLAIVRAGGEHISTRHSIRVGHDAS